MQRSDKISALLLEIEESMPFLEVLKNEPLKNHTSMRIGGNIRAIFFPKDTKVFISLMKTIRGSGIEPIILGKGTNILADDKDLDLVAISTTGLDNIDKTGDCEITACAGVLLSKLSVFAYENGLSGLEFAHGIPGTLGGAIVMNAGAYEGEIKDVVVRTTILSEKSEVIELTAADSKFSYRNSRFSETNEVVLSSVFNLRRENPETIKKTMDELAVLRRESQPLEALSAGSTFKRPKEGFAATRIEQANLKGYRAGDAEVSTKHAGFIINRGKASFDDCMTVIDHVRKTVLDKTGVELEVEVKIIE